MPIFRQRFAFEYGLPGMSMAGSFKGRPRNAFSKLAGKVSLAAWLIGFLCLPPSATAGTLQRSGLAKPGSE
jgi:hypothetical protein